MTDNLLRGALFLVTLALGGCAPDRPPNILLISLDTLRGDSLGCYGYGRDTTPFLDQLAAEGVRFENAFVNTLATTPSHVTLLSGQYQESHGVLFDSHREEGSEAVSIPDSIIMLPELLAAAGYETLAVTDGGNLARRHGFDRGFDEFDGDRASGVARGIARLLAMLDRRAPTSEPLFVLFHTYEIHSPYKPPPPYDTIFGELPDSDFVASSGNLRRVINNAAEVLSENDFKKIRMLYDGGIRYTDSALRGLFQGLEERDFFEGDYLVVVTADHGEEFGERGGVLHRGLLYEELLHVPLIVKARRAPVSEVRTDLVSIVDIAPTILTYANIEVPETMQGEDFLDRAPYPSERQFAFAQFRGHQYAVRTPRWKFISAKEPQLYDLTSDPGELYNLALENPDRVGELQQILDRWRSTQEGRRPQAGEGGELTSEQLDEMKALGYVN